MEMLIIKGYTVVAMVNGSARQMPEGVEIIRCDLTSSEFLEKLSREWWGAIHLAAISVLMRFTSSEFILANTKMTKNLLDHLNSGRVLLVSSCHIYASAWEPRQENDSLKPRGMYVLLIYLCEKILDEHTGKIDIRIARPFNHIGPMMPKGLLILSMVERLSNRSTADSSPLLMQGMDSIRDFVDVRDVAMAYIAILEMEFPISRIYNLCTAVPTSVSSVVLERLDLQWLKCEFIFYSQQIRQDDSPTLVGKNDVLNKEIGWKQAYSISDSLRTLLTEKLT